MLGITHTLFSIFIALLFHKIGVGGAFYASIAFSLLGGLLPDIDDSKSTLGRYFKIGWLFKHRGVFHSLISAIISSIILAIFLKGLNSNMVYTLYFFLSYLGHLLLDSFTREGVRFFYPKKKIFHGKLKTNSLFEKLFLILLFLIIFYFVLLL